MKTRCDICGFRDGHGKLVLISCDKCELHVHKECYGMPSFTLKTFTCWACQAVGKSFEIEERNELGNRRRILQEHRPLKCALCNVSEGDHAMHPLYDRAGPGGRQIYVDGGLAWVHTLCAFSLSLRSLLFGCSRDGFYDGDDEDSEDERSENSELMDDTQEGDEFGTQFAPIHHFVYDRLKWSKEQIRAIKELKQLRCSICGADDKPEDVLRVCLQCNANDDIEFKDFQGKHPSLASDEQCTLALHVGCARWGGLNANGVQRVYYFPGDNKEEPVVNLFCTLHAEDVDHRHQQQLRLMEDRRRTEQQERRLERLGRPQSPQLHPPRNNRSDLDDKIRSDLIRTVATIREDRERRIEVLKERKQHWKSELNMLTPEQFKEVWKTAKANIADYIVHNGDHGPTQRATSREASVPRVAAHSQANANKTKRILQDQKKVAQAIENQKRRSHTENESPRRSKSASYAVKQTGSKRRRSRMQVNADDDSGEEFQWEQNDNEADVEICSVVNSKKGQSGTDSFVSLECHPIPKIFKHPLPRSCECFKVEFLERQEYKRPPPRDKPLDDFGNWDLL